MTDVSGLAVTNVNVPQFRPCGPVGGKIAAATVGVPYFGWYHSPAQVITATWRAAGSRWNYGVIATGNQWMLICCAKHHLYNTFGTNYRIFNVSIIVLRFKKCEKRGMLSSLYCDIFSSSTFTTETGTKTEYPLPRRPGRGPLRCCPSCRCRPGRGWRRRGSGWCGRGWGVILGGRHRSVGGGCRAGRRTQRGRWPW